MADIELVIKIPEEEYDVVQNEVYHHIISHYIWEAVKNGVVLPKGHGKLKDADKFNYNSDNYITKHGVESAPTIIEADKKPTCGDCKEWGTVNCPETYREPTKNDDICDSFKTESEGK